MAFKVRRQSRKWWLLQAGFLKQEAHTLSSMPSKKIPYFKMMVQERKSELKVAMQEGWTQYEFKNYILKKYFDNGWLIKETAVTRTKSWGKPDPWAMLRWYRDRFIEKYPDEYIPPPKKKKKHKELKEGEIKQKRTRISQIEKYVRGRFKE